MSEHDGGFRVFASSHAAVVAYEFNMRGRKVAIATVEYTELAKSNQTQARLSTYSVFVSFGFQISKN
jgi:hypothetical protein